MSELKLPAASGGGSISIKGPSSSGDDVDLLDTSGNLKPSGQMYLNDDKKLILGTGGDMEIYHLSDQNYIYSGNGRINLRASEVRCENAAGTEVLAKFIADGTCELRYNDSKTFETLEYGARVSRASGGACGLDVVGPEGHAAELYLFSDDGDDNGDKWMLTAEPEQDFSIKSYLDGTWNHCFWTNGEQVYLYYNDSSRFLTTSDGVETSYW